MLVSHYVQRLVKKVAVNNLYVLSQVIIEIYKLFTHHGEHTTCSFNEDKKSLVVQAFENIHF